MTCGMIRAISVLLCDANLTRTKMVALSNAEESTACCVSKLNTEEFEDGKERGYISYLYFLNTTPELAICIGRPNAEQLRKHALVSAAGNMAIGFLKVPWNIERQTFALVENSTVVRHQRIPLDDLGSAIAAIDFTPCGQVKCSFDDPQANVTWTDIVERCTS